MSPLAPTLLGVPFTPALALEALAHLEPPRRPSSALAALWAAMRRVHPGVDEARAWQALRAFVERGLGPARPATAERPRSRWEWSAVDLKRAPLPAARMVKVAGDWEEVLPRWSGAGARVGVERESA